MFDKVIPRSEFTKNVLTALTGTALAQAIPILISPFLTRYFTEADFGLFFLFTSIMAMLSVFSTAKYELAIILPEKDEDAINIVVLVCLIAFGVSLTILGIIMFFREEIQEALDDHSSGYWLYLVPLSLLLSGVYQAFNYWSNRKKRFRELSIGKIGQSSVTGGSNLSIGNLAPSGIGLIWSTIAGQFTNIVVLLRRFLKTDREMISYVNADNMGQQAKRYGAFPKQMVLANIFNISAMQIPNIVLASMFGSAFLGVFALSQRVVKLPIVVISSAYGEVLKQEASEKLARGGDIKQLFWKSLLSLSLVSLPPFVILYLFAPEIFSFVFGEKWLSAGEYAKILTPYFYLAFITVPLTHLFYILERTRIYLVIQAFLLLCVLGGLYVGQQWESPTTTLVYVLSASYSSVYLIMLASLAVIIGKK
ncbi:MAG: oligosaccharide flippase family protein [Flavobacteriales bacterium]|nr:oligosaccharide flippase family protein [Flavobacteriales bacterium]